MIRSRNSFASEMLLQKMYIRPMHSYTYACYLIEVDKKIELIWVEAKKKFKNT